MQFQNQHQYQQHSSKSSIGKNLSTALPTLIPSPIPAPTQHACIQTQYQFQNQPSSNLLVRLRHVTAHAVGNQEKTREHAGKKATLV